MSESFYEYIIPMFIMILDSVAHNLLGPDDGEMAVR
jgi:hypothetical protein